MEATFATSGITTTTAGAATTIGPLDEEDMGEYITVAFTAGTPPTANGPTGSIPTGRGSLTTPADFGVGTTTFGNSPAGLRLLLAQAAGATPFSAAPADDPLVEGCIVFELGVEKRRRRGGHDVAGGRGGSRDKCYGWDSHCLLYVCLYVCVYVVCM